MPPEETPKPQGFMGGPPLGYAPETPPSPLSPEMKLAQDLRQTYEDLDRRQAEKQAKLLEAFETGKVSFFELKDGLPVIHTPDPSTETQKLPIGQNPELDPKQEAKRRANAISTQGYYEDTIGQKQVHYMSGNKLWRNGFYAVESAKPAQEKPLLSPEGKVEDWQQQPVVLDLYENGKGMKICLYAPDQLIKIDPEIEKIFTYFKSTFPQLVKSGLILEIETPSSNNELTAELIPTSSKGNRLAVNTADPQVQAVVNWGLEELKKVFGKADPVSPPEGITNLPLTELPAKESLHTQDTPSLPDYNPVYKDGLWVNPTPQKTTGFIVEYAGQIVKDFEDAQNRLQQDEITVEHAEGDTFDNKAWEKIRNNSKEIRRLKEQLEELEAENERLYERIDEPTPTNTGPKKTTHEIDKQAVEVLPNVLAQIDQVAGALPKT